MADLYSYGELKGEWDMHYAGDLVMGLGYFNGPCVLKLWLGVGKGMLSVKHFCSTKPLLVSVKLNRHHRTATKMRQNLASLNFGDITSLQIAKSVCLCWQAH